MTVIQNKPLGRWPGPTQRGSIPLPIH